MSEADLPVLEDAIADLRSYGRYWFVQSSEAARAFRDQVAAALGGDGIVLWHSPPEWEYVLVDHSRSNAKTKPEIDAIAKRRVAAKAHGLDRKSWPI